MTSGIISLISVNVIQYFYAHQGALFKVWDYIAI